MCLILMSTGYLALLAPLVISFTFNIFFVLNFCRARVSANKDSCVVEDEGRVGSLNVEWNSFLPRTKWCNFTRLIIYAWTEKKDGWLHSRLKNLLLTSVLTYSRKTHSECLGLKRSFIGRLCWRLSPFWALVGLEGLKFLILYTTFLKFSKSTSWSRST